MNIHETISNAMKDHKNKIEITQWAVISSIASLVFSEYISNIKQKTKPVRKVLVPPIKYVNELLDPSSSFMKTLSEKLIDGIASNELIEKYKDAPELVLFKEENIDTIKTIFDLYMIPNISRRIPETISKKFQLDDEKNQLIQQDSSLDLFGRKAITEKQLDYIIEETVLQLIMIIPSIEKESEGVENNKSFYVPADKSFAFTINNQEAICPIIFNANILNNDEVIDLLNFVTSTSLLKDVDDGKLLTTGVFNQVTITMFK